MPSGVCNHAYAGAREGICGGRLDPSGRHAVQCMVGGDHYTLHDAICDEIAKAQRTAGLRARREVSVPGLAKPGLEEPGADLAVWEGGSVALHAI